MSGRVSGRRWWASRSVRARIALSAAIPVALALVVGTVAVTAVFSAGRLHDLDAQTEREAEAIIGLVSSGQLPATLPAPAGSPLLVQVIAGDGSVVAATPSASRIQPLAEIPHRTQRTTRTDEEGSYAGVPLRLRVQTASFEGKTFYVVVAAPLGDVRRALRALRVVLLFVVPLLVLAVTLLVWWVAGLALRPVELLRAAAGQLVRHPPELRRPTLLPVPAHGDEISRLAQTLNELLGVQRRLLEQQESFVSDAAHELRSPVASLRVQLEVAQAHPADLDVPELLRDLSHDTERLGRLADDLLALARLDAGYPLRPEVVDLRELAHADGEAVLVQGEAFALGRLVENLVSNARQHAATVRVTTSRAGDDAVLTVDDDGPGIPAADRDRVFDRWVRLDAARARPDGGSGLGLSIARETARRHGGDLEVLDSPLGGARLRLRLPAVRSGTTVDPAS